MVVDLERSIAAGVRSGTVSVDPLMDVASTPFCHLLVSGVRGTLRPEATLTTSSSRLPLRFGNRSTKRAAMRIIHRLEPQPAMPMRCPRGRVAGEIDSSVLIRTLEGTSADGHMGRGCGITYDSERRRSAELLLKHRLYRFRCSLATLVRV